MKQLIKVSFAWLFISILISCQKKQMINVQDQIDINKFPSYLYNGKWLSINEEKNNEYYYCTDTEKFIQIDNNKIYYHTPMEGSHFTIDHIKNEVKQTYLFLDKKESSFYILSWLHKEKGIISCQLNNYEPDLFIAEKEVKTIKNKSCQSKNKSCIFNDPSGKYMFILEAGEFINEKEKQYPVSAWIIIKDRKGKTLQEIHFEPNSWATMIDLPCKKFVIRDFNFDGLIDFALLWDTGGNAGELYEYYFQDKNRIFTPAETFPLQHGMLAENINIPAKTISVQNSIACCHYNLTIYKLKSNESWEVSSEQRQLKKK